MDSVVRADELQPSMLGCLVEFTDRGTSIRGRLRALEVRQEEAYASYQLYDDAVWRSTPIELQVGEWTGSVLPGTIIEVQETTAKVKGK